MRERIKLILKFLALVCGVGLIVFIWKALPVISGYSAKVACSGIFVSGRVQDSVLRNDLASFPLNLSWVSVDYQDSSVTASVLGLARRKAVYRWRLGATLINGMTEEVFREIHMIRPRGVERVADTIDWPQGDRAVAVAEPPQLDAAIGKAFGEGGESPTGTRAVVVVWHGQVVGERYAPGFDKNTRLAGWSMTKSITNALAGILVKEGKLTIDSSAPVREWEGDERRQIKVADLMHMNSGLRWWEFYGGPSDATDMLFKEANMGGYAANSGMKHPPGQVFNYSSGTANILSAIIRKIVGDEYYYRFPYEQLFEKTGMYSAVLEPDAS